MYRRAREMMQLFTIGVYQLDSDGRHTLDEQGNRIHTYTNDHGAVALTPCCP